MKESKEVAIWKMFLAWKRDLFDEEGNFKRKTSGGQCMRLRNSFLILHS